MGRKRVQVAWKASYRKITAPPKQFQKPMRGCPIRLFGHGANQSGTGLLYSKTALRFLLFNMLLCTS
jgi:hypothetical protein